MDGEGTAQWGVTHESATVSQASRFFTGHMLMSDKATTAPPAPQRTPVTAAVASRFSRLTASLTDALADDAIEAVLDQVRTCDLPAVARLSKRCKALVTGAWPGL